jgi:SAM-dependent methyltransferase
VRRPSERVQKYYRQYDEWHRLAQDPYHALEYETTLHFLGKYLPPRGVLLDAGGGPGRYTVELAKRGYDVTLLDLSTNQLEVARRQIRRAGVADRVSGVVRGSLHDLGRFKSGTFDAVLCLGGALGHLVDRRDRRRALGELARVARRGAPIFISVIGRYSQLTDESGRVSAGFPDSLDSGPEFYLRALESGDYDGGHGFAPCHFYLPEELESELERRHLRVVERVGLEGLASRHLREFNRLARTRPRAWANWKVLHLATCTDPAVVATSTHFMIVCRKPPA